MSLAFSSDFQSSIPRILPLSQSPSIIHLQTALLVPSGLLLSHHVTTVYDVVSMCHADNMLSAEALINTGSYLCLKDLTAQSSTHCNIGTLGTSSEKTTRSALVTASTIVHFLEDEVQASQKI